MKLNGRRAVMGGVAGLCAAALLVACGGGGGGGGSAKGTKTTAPTTTAVTTTTTAPPINYVVQRGDTLTSIARKFNVSLAAILAANPNQNPDRLSEGQSLVIPPPLPVALVITPPTGPAGTDFQFKATGLKAGETVQFAIDGPGTKFTGPPHSGSEGVATATYQSGLDAQNGTYNVAAIGSQGTTASASFQIVGASTATTASTPS
jgi:LysM repeat protein